MQRTQYRLAQKNSYSDKKNLILLGNIFTVAQSGSRVFNDYSISYYEQYDSHLINSNFKNDYTNLFRSLVSLAIGILKFTVISLKKDTRRAGLIFKRLLKNFLASWNKGNLHHFKNYNSAKKFLKNKFADFMFRCGFVKFKKSKYSIPNYSYKVYSSHILKEALPSYTEDLESVNYALSCNDIDGDVFRTTTEKLASSLNEVPVNENYTIKIRPLDSRPETLPAPSTNLTSSSWKSSSARDFSTAPQGKILGRQGESKYST
jgi:hypothetical protein